MRSKQFTKGLGFAMTWLAVIISVFMLFPAHTEAVDIASFAPIFNAEYYAAANRDVSNLLGKDANTLFNHFLKYGMAEGRRGSEEFDVSYYRWYYPDLDAAFGNDLKQYYLHYLNCGKAEGRIGAVGAPATQLSPAQPVTVPQTALVQLFKQANPYFDDSETPDLIATFNQYRAAAGLAPLQYDARLTDILIERYFDEYNRVKNSLTCSEKASAMGYVNVKSVGFQTNDSNVNRLVEVWTPKTDWMNYFLGDYTYIGIRPERRPQDIYFDVLLAK